MKKLFIGKLSFSTTDEGLRKAFESYGNVSSATVITDRESGRSRGFGFVEMEDNSAADEAIAGMNNAELDGWKIVVNEARPMKPRNGGGGGGGGFGGRRGGGGGGNRSW